MAPWTKAASERFGVGKSLLLMQWDHFVLGAFSEAIAAPHVCSLAVLRCDYKVEALGGGE